jgi:hypothetical protein
MTTAEGQCNTNLELELELAADQCLGLCEEQGTTCQGQLSSQGQEDNTMEGRITE